MSARRLGRLVGSALAIAALVGGVYTAELGELQTFGFDWSAPSLVVSVDSPTATGLYAQSLSDVGGEV